MRVQFHHFQYLLIFIASNIGANFAKSFNCSCTKDSIAEMENNDFTYFEKAGDIKNLTVYDYRLTTIISMADETTIVTKNNKQHFQLNYNNNDTVDIFTANATVIFNSISKERMTVDVNSSIFALETADGQITVDIKNFRGNATVNAKNATPAFEVILGKNVAFLVYDGKRSQKIQNNTVVVYDNSLAKLSLSKELLDWKMTLYHSRDGVLFTVTMTQHYVNFDSVRGTIKMLLSPSSNDTTHKQSQFSSHRSQFKAYGTVKNHTMYLSRYPPYHVYHEHIEEDMTEKLQICRSSALNICAWNVRGALHFSLSEDKTHERVIGNDGALDVTRNGNIRLRGTRHESINISDEARTLSIADTAQSMRFQLANRTLQATIGNDTFAVSEHRETTVHCGASSKAIKKNVSLGHDDCGCQNVGGGASIDVGKLLGLGWRLASAAISANLSADGKTFVADSRYLLAKISANSVEVRTKSTEELNEGYVKVDKDIFHVKTAAGHVHIEKGVVNFVSLFNQIAVKPTTKSAGGDYNGSLAAKTNFGSNTTSSTAKPSESSTVSLSNVFIATSANSFTVSLASSAPISTTVSIGDTYRTTPDVRQHIVTFDTKVDTTSANSTNRIGARMSAVNDCALNDSSNDEKTVSTCEVARIMGLLSQLVPKPTPSVPLHTTVTLASTHDGLSSTTNGDNRIISYSTETSVSEEMSKNYYDSVNPSTNSAQMNGGDSTAQQLYGLANNESTVTSWLSQETSETLNKMRSTASPATVTVTVAMNNGIIKDTNTTFAQYENTTTTTTITLPSTTTVGYGSERGSPPRHETATASDSSNRLVPLAHISIASVAREFRPESVEKESFSQIAPNSASAERRTTTIATVSLLYLLLAVLPIV